MHQNQNEGPPTSSAPNKTLPVAYEHSSPSQPPQIVIESGKNLTCGNNDCLVCFFF